MKLFCSKRTSISLRQLLAIGRVILKGLAGLRKEIERAHPALRFVDEFPLVREAQPFAGETSGWFVVLDELRVKFAQLPDPDSDAAVVQRALLQTKAGQCAV